MRILLTGGAGDLAQVLTPLLENRGDEVLLLDIRQPASGRGTYIAGSVNDRQLLAQIFPDVDCLVHIAAWHGYHEFHKLRTPFEFWDLNVTGTFNVLEAAVRAGITNVVFMSSTSIEERSSIYGSTKILAEELCRHYALRHNLNIIILRPRAFIPYWNRTVYQDYIEWAHWFWGGAVHINDVAQATILGIDILSRQHFAEPPALVVDGAYDYSAEQLANWDVDGPGSTFRHTYPDHEALVLQFGLDPAQKPTTYDLSLTTKILGYQPQFSLGNLLAELAEYGRSGPPAS